jgi:tetratricopeptide (TPR) repeat protein
MHPFIQRLIEATPEVARRLITERPTDVGEQEIEGLTEHVRRVATADPVASLRAAETARELARALGAARGVALAERAYGVALRAHGDPAAAVEAFTAGIRFARDAGDPLLAAQIPIAATYALAQVGRYQEAIELASTSEAELRRLNADEDAAKVISNAGSVYFEREDFSRALECWQRALDYFQRAGQPVAVARLQMNIANALTQLNQLAEALDIYRSALVTLGEAGMDFHVAAVEGNIGFLQFMAGEYTEALRAYTRARQGFERLGLGPDVAKCDRETADLYLELNLYPEARETYDRVLPLFEDLGLAGEAARAELGRAVVLMAQGLADEAAAALDRAEAAFAATATKSAGRASTSSGASCSRGGRRPARAATRWTLPIRRRAGQIAGVRHELRSGHSSETASCWPRLRAECDWPSSISNKVAGRSAC